MAKDNVAEKKTPTQEDSEARRASLRVIDGGPEPQKFNDAVVFGDIESDEAQAVLNSSITVMTAPGRETPGARWKIVETTVGQLLNRRLSVHLVSTEKDGEAFVYAKGKKAGTSKAGDETIIYGHRVQNKIEEITGFIADVDGTDKARRVAERIHELGLFGVVYTTHSHAAKKTQNGDRFRVIVFLDKPVPFPKGMQERSVALKEYRARFAGLCELLGLSEIDSTSMNLHQMMYTPRRASKDAEFEHYVVAGRAQKYEEMPLGDTSKYRKSKGGTGRRLTDKGTSGAPAILSDGFDLKHWYADGGRHVLLGDVLDALGWDVRGSGSGDWVEIQCPNAAQHTDPEDDAAGFIEGQDGFGVHCFHDHCEGLGLKHLVLIEQAILAGEVALPDEYQRFSELLCDSSFHPEIDGETFDARPEDFGGRLPIQSLRTADAVKKAVEAALANEDVGDEDFLRIYAGVEKGGGKVKAREALASCLSKVKTYKTNDLKSLEKRGKELLQAERDHEVEEIRRQAVADADLHDEGVNTSMDPSAPLGDDLKTSLGTLRCRYAVADVGGKFRIVRRPDLDKLGSEHDPTVIFYTKQDFLDLHMNRFVKTKKGNIEYPAEVFLESEPRKSGIVFAPPPCVAGPNAFNMYYGRTLNPKPGDWLTLEKFIRDLVCCGDKDKYDWLMLWMAHLVQRPGEKPGTAIIAIGLGGVGKDTFGEILKRLCLPHAKTLEKESHVVGQFAGEHLSKCVLAVVTEAVFGKNPKIASELKGMVTNPEVTVEAKGLNVITMLSFLRLYINSNDAVPVLIEQNGSERRYWVIKFSDARKGDEAYWNEIYAAINGGEMAALLAYLETYDPSEHGQSWNDVRVAPWTEEREVMGWHSMSLPMRRLKEVLAEGEVTLNGADGSESYEAGPNGLRVPLALFRDHIAMGTRGGSEDRDVPAMFARLLPDVELRTGQGKVGMHDNKRWIEFPVEVLGD